MMRRFCLFAVCLAALAGCDFNVYDLDMECRGDELARTLTVWRTDSPENMDRATREMSAQELAAIAEAYAAGAPSRAEGKHTFSGTFRTRTPADIGGAGVYHRYSTRLGDTCVYVERFRGSDRPGAAAQRIFDAADRLTELLSAWLALELGPTDNASGLRGFLEDTFRQDLKDLAMHVWLASNASRVPWLGASEEASEGLLARAALYLLERGYLRPEDIPAIRRCKALPMDQEQAALVSLLVRRVLERAGVPTRSAEYRQLTALAENLEGLEQSLNTRFGRSEAYDALLRKCAAEGRLSTDESSPEPVNLLNTLAREMLAVNLSPSSGDRLRASLQCEGQVVHTNGRLDDTGRHVRWEAPLTSRDEPTALLPVNCFAVWARPGAEAQRALLGGTVLEGRALVDYCFWRAGLTDAEAARWTGLLEGLSRDADGMERLTRLAEQEPGSTAEGVLAEGASLLLKAIEDRPATQNE